MDEAKTVPIGQRIRAFRQRMGLTVDELAVRIGKNRCTLYRYESGEIPDVPLGVIRGMAKALDVPPAVLAGWEEGAAGSDDTEKKKRKKYESENSDGCERHRRGRDGKESRGQPAAHGRLDVRREGTVDPIPDHSGRQPGMHGG